MVQVQEISVAEFERIPEKPAPLGETGRDSVEILGTLLPGRPIMIRGASRGFQVALTQRIKRDNLKVEMRVIRESAGLRSIALLKRR